MASISERQVTKENGILKGYTASKPTHNVVADINVIFPQTVQTPPYFEPLFSSYVLRQDKVTPGTIVSTTTSHEHFLNKPLIRSGTCRNRGEDNSEAQSLYDRDSIQWRVIAIVVTLTTQIPIDKNACLRVLKQKSFMHPTQINEAKMSQRIQLQQRHAMIIIIAVKPKDKKSHIRNILQMFVWKYFTKQSISFKQRNEKNAEIAIPKYLSPTKALEKSLTANRVKPTKTIIETTLKIANGTHLSYTLGERVLNVIDHMCEFIATPIIIAALIIERIRYPNQNGLWRWLGSQFNRKLKIYPQGRETVTLLQQLLSVIQVGQLKYMVKSVVVVEFKLGLGYQLGDTSMMVLVQFKITGVMSPEYLIAILLVNVVFMMLRQPFRQLPDYSYMVSSQTSFSLPSKQICDQLGQTTSLFTIFILKRMAWARE